MSESELFGAFAERWITEVGPLRLKSTAVAEYASLLRLHILPFFADRPVAGISACDIQNYMAFKVESGLSPRSVRNHLVVLRAVLKSAASLGVVDTNVAIKVTAPKHQRVEQRFPTPGEMRAILDACPPAWVIALALPVYSAARKGESLALRWSSVSVSNRQIAYVRSIRGGVESTVKSSASRASVAMAEELVPLFLERQKMVPDPVNGYVLCDRSGAPLKDHVPNAVLRRACQKADVGHFTYHQLRHGSIAALIASGAHPLVVSRFARHASVATTLDEYGHIMAPLAGCDAISELSRTISGSEK